MCRRVLVVGAVTAVVLIVAGWSVFEFWTGPDGFAAFRPVRPPELMSRPEARLYLPKAKLLSVETQDMVPPFIASSCKPALVSSQRAADASDDEVRAWYNTSLQELGWESHPNQTLAAVVYWYRGSREEFDIYFLSPGDNGYVQTNRSTEYVANYLLLNYTPSKP